MRTQELKIIGTTIDYGEVRQQSVCLDPHSLVFPWANSRTGVGGLLGAGILKLARVKDGYLTPPWMEVDGLVVRCRDDHAIRLHHVHGADSDEIVDADIAEIALQIDQGLLAIHCLHCVGVWPSQYAIGSMISRVCEGDGRQS